jgi:N-acetylglucosamine-6-phosphate deacetylase
VTGGPTGAPGTGTLHADAVCLPGADPSPGWVSFADGRIVDCGFGAAPQPGIDLGDAVLAPGYIDLQCNGLGTVDLASAGADGWAQLASTLAGRGTTAFCPTFVTAPRADYDHFLTAAAAAANAADGRGAASVGVHLEGPFLGGAPGVHRVDLITTADPVWLARLLDEHPGVVRIVTLAPEADPDSATIRMLSERGVLVSLGHSLAGFDAARDAAHAGARAVTHLFNGMGPLHHRSPGLAGAALDDDRLTPTLIADLVHVAPALLRLAIARKRDVALVSDAVAGPEQDGAVRRADGTLTGGAITLDRAVANVVGLGVPVARAVELATAIPAELLGLDDRGRIVSGARADLVALDPHSSLPRAVWLAGEPVSVAEAGR